MKSVQCGGCLRWFLIGIIAFAPVNELCLCPSCQLQDPLLNAADREALETLIALGAGTGFESQLALEEHVAAGAKSITAIREQQIAFGIVDPTYNPLRTVADHEREWPITCAFFGWEVSDAA